MLLSSEHAISTYRVYQSYQEWWRRGKDFPKFAQKAESGLDLLLAGPVVLPHKGYSPHSFCPHKNMPGI